RLIDRVILFIAPLLIGGRDAVPAIGGEGFDKLKEAVHLSEVRLRKLGRDFVLTANVEKI
ncbi:MAG: dihydrofolate reductase family protein, partial [Armatimonadota bacterium]